MSTHFEVTASRFIPFEGEEGMCCPLVPGLRVLGLAITACDQYHLVLSLGQERIYAGPDEQTVSRRAEIMALGLEASGVIAQSQRASVTGWVMGVWDATVDALASVIAGPDLAHLPETHHASRPAGQDG